MTAELPPGEAESLAFALITAKRTGMEHQQVHDMINGSLKDLTGGDPDLVIFALSQMVWALALMADGACRGWGQAVGGDPAEEWLASMAKVTADVRAGLMDV